MDSLSNDLYLLLLSYLQEIDQIEWCLCKKKWYDEILKRNIRKLRIVLSGKNDTELETWINRSLRLIERPFDQLDIDEFPREYIPTFDLI